MIVSILKIITIDVWVFHSFWLNYILIGMAFSATLVNLVPEEKTEAVFEKYNPLLNLSLVFVIINPGMPLGYRLIWRKNNKSPCHRYKISGFYPFAPLRGFPCIHRNCRCYFK